jgi:Phospholipase_D-nuclease N-terminal
VIALPDAGILFLSNFIGGILLVLIAVTWLVALVDLIRRPDLTGGKKLAWAVLIIVLPLIGTVVYFALRPTLDDEAERIIAREVRRH